MTRTKTRTNRFRIRLLPFSALLAVFSLLPGCDYTDRTEAAGDTPEPMPQVADGAVRLVCWNIQWFPGKSTRADDERQSQHIREIREALSSLQPDILLAQEIRSEDPLLEALDGVAGHQLGVISRFPGRQQTATTGRIPLVAGWFECWERDGNDDPPRGFSNASFRLSDGLQL